MTVHHILVPIDFSPYAEQALDYAIALAQKLQARVTLLHVIQPPVVVNVPKGVYGRRRPFSRILKQPSQVIWKGTWHGLPPRGSRGRWS